MQNGDFREKSRLKITGRFALCFTNHPNGRQGSEISGWKAYVATLKEASLEFSILYDPDDADFTAFQSAYFSNTPMALFISDGQDTAHGLDADFSITAFSMEQPLEEAISVSVTANPTASTRAPQWV